MAQGTVWKVVPGFQRYEASETGEVRRRFASPHKPNFYPAGSAVWMLEDRKGYLRARLVDDQGNAKNAFVHRAVALAFHGLPPPGRDCVAHADGSKQNNRPGNLRWASPAENSADRDRQGRGMRGKRMPTCQGSKHYRAKLTEAQVLAIRHQSGCGWSLHEIAALYGMGHNAIRCIVLRKTWKHI